MYKLDFACARRYVDRRREMRTFDSGKPHANRNKVKPTVGDSDHYGSS
ncbi:MAG: hypothetical protein GY854_21475 [Deltaproteobacteria bacterium]|nr:hypothetical protein [Deltaproteobacteria bacterium]